jgi:glycosyltransferase involved in cell wall biosynthesis
MACGLPVITTEATAGPDVVREDCGSLFEAGDVHGLVDRLRWYAAQRDQIATMGAAARARAESHDWERYRECVSNAVAPIC